MNEPSAVRKRLSGAGFTLVEMSIVLVMIGLVIGGVLVGRDLIYQTQLRQTASTIQKYITAVETFRGKYSCLPGDCANATSIFGATDANGNTVNNGNGDGTVGLCSSVDGTGNGVPCRVASQALEMWGFWQQLGDANLISGRYSGVDSGGGFPVPGANVPPSN
jgi:prepilin-type N-terminal cleavage/methylation domain-containing protein